MEKIHYFNAENILTTILLRNPPTSAPPALRLGLLQGFTCILLPRGPVLRHRGAPTGDHPSCCVGMAPTLPKGPARGLQGHG